MANTIIYFIVTLLTEFAVICLFMKKFNLKLFAYVFLINLFTWPLTTLFIQTIWTNFRAFGLLIFAPLIVEACAILAEGGFLKFLLEMKYSRALIISLVANITSIIMGIVFSALRIA